MNASAVIVVVLLGYLLVLLAIGWWARRESRDVAGYYVAGKKLPSWVIAFSTNATGESAWLLLGLTGMGYLVGIHALWIVVGEVVGLALAWALVARPFKEYTDRYDAVTVPDYLADRFRDRAHVLRVVSAVVIFSMASFYTAAQLTAAGTAFEQFLGLTYEWGVLIGAAIILYYTTVGGFKAVAYSDLLQGVLMFLCLLTLPVVGFLAVGGWGEVMARLHSIDPGLVEPMGGLGLGAVGVASLLGFVGIGLAFLGSPQLLTRFISSQNNEEPVEASVIGVVCLVVFGLGAVLTGIAGRALFPGLDDPETIYPLMGGELFPAVFTGIFLVVVLAAMMSTVDSLLILASSAAVRDVLQKIFRPDVGERVVSMLGKGVTVILGLGGLWLALMEARVIFWFVLFAWAGLASAFAPVVLCSLFWKGTTRAGAIAGMIAGFGTTMLWVLLVQEHVHDLYEMIPGFAAGFLATIGVSLVTDPPEGAAEEFDSVWRTVGPAFGAPEAPPLPVDEEEAAPGRPGVAPGD